MKKMRITLLSLLVSWALAGCASESAQAEVKSMKENKDDYVDYYPPGSAVPVKIRKDRLPSSLAESAQTR
jgi:hypothetical protein